MRDWTAFDACDEECYCWATFEELARVCREESRGMLARAFSGCADAWLDESACAGVANA